MQNSKIKSAVQNGRKFVLFTFALCLLPLAFASAHEAYIMPADMMDAAIVSASPNPLLAYFGNEGNFYFWAAISIIVTLTVFFASTFRAFETRMMPLFSALKRAAHPIVRVTVGVTLVVFALTEALYGPEIPLEEVFGAFSALAQAALLLLGVGVLVGFQTRVLATLALGLYIYAAFSLGLYSFMYVQHAAAYIALIILGGGAWTLDHRFRFGWKLGRYTEQLSRYAFPLLRVALGASIMFAAFYAKFLHSNLALRVVEMYHLDAFFPFEPLFIVLGAFIIEFLAGLMICIGVEIRWTVIFLVFWLTLAHFTLPEPFWVHFSLYGLGAAILCHGYDRFSIEGYFFKRKKMEPVL